MDAALKRAAGPPLNRKRPSIAGTMAGAQVSISGSSEAEHNGVRRLHQQLRDQVIRELSWGRSSIAARLESLADELAAAR